MASYTLLQALAFVADPELPMIKTPHGTVQFIQIVGLTLDEMEAGKQWQTRGLLNALLPHMPLWTTDLSRTSLLSRSDVRDTLAAGSARDGSSLGMLMMPAFGWSTRKRVFRSPATVVRLGAGHVEELLQSLSLRLPFGRNLLLAGSAEAIKFMPGEVPAVSEEDGRLSVTLTPANLDALCATLRPVGGQYQMDGLPALVWEGE